MSDKLQIVQMSLRNAQNWDHKGDPVWARSCVDTALMNLLSVAVERFDALDAAKEWLAQADVPTLLRRSHGYLSRIAKDVDSQVAPPSTLGGNYPHFVFAHLSWVLGDMQQGESFVSFGNRNDIADISTPFWCEYGRGLGMLAVGRPYEVKQQRLKGQEKYWVTYLQLVERATQELDLGTAIDAVNQAFSRRNSDLKIKDDNYETEGSGVHPARWDYRRDSLLTYISHKKRR